MKSRSTMRRGSDPATFIEPECTIEHEGREYTSGGAWIGRHRETGLLGGMLYAHRTNGRPTHVGSWGGEIRIPAHFGREWESSFGDVRQAVYFSYEDHSFYGVWYSKEWSDIVRCRELKQPRGDGHPHSSG